MAGQGGGARHPGDRAGGPGSGELQHARPQGGKQDRRRLGAAAAPSRAFMVKLSVGVRLLPGHQRLQGRKVVRQIADRSVTGQPVHRLQRRGVGETETQRQSASRQGLRGDRLFGERHRMPRLHRHNRRAEFRPTGSPRRHQSQHVESKVLRHPDGRKANRHGLAVLGLQRRDRVTVTPGLSQHDPNTHLWSPDARRTIAVRKRKGTGDVPSLQVDPTRLRPTQCSLASPEDPPTSMSAARRTTFTRIPNSLHCLTSARVVRDHDGDGSTAPYDVRPLSSSARGVISAEAQRMAGDGPPLRWWTSRGCRR